MQPAFIPSHFLTVLYQKSKSKSKPNQDKGKEVSETDSQRYRSQPTWHSSELVNKTARLPEGLQVLRAYYSRKMFIFARKVE